MPVPGAMASVRRNSANAPMGSPSSSREPECLTGRCLSLQVMGVEREAEPQFEVAACLVQPALFVFDDAE
jgi:hypothetical protein